MRNTAVIIDDVALNRDILTDILEDQYTILEAGDGKTGLDMIVSHLDEIAVVALDLMMPVMDGFEVLKTLNDQELSSQFPILIISGATDLETEERCLLGGATEFIRKPFNAALTKHRINNAVALYQYKNSLEDKVAEQTQTLRRQTDQLKRQNEELENKTRNIIELLGNVVEARNRESGTHLRRVKHFTKLLATDVLEHYPEYGLTPQRVSLFAEASNMHDLGKIMISDNILLKPGRLTDVEFDEMKNHTVYGCDVLNSNRRIFGSDTEYYDACYRVCRHHHEKWDGRGYPDGLAGDDIPLEAQIVSVADCYDALTTERPYKKPFSPDTAYEMLQTGACGQFNPRLMESLTRCKSSFEAFVKETSENNEKE